MLRAWVDPIPTGVHDKEEQQHWLNTLLSSALNCPTNSLELSTNPYGKPYLIHHPNWHFNISHSKTFRALSLSDKLVGIDVERQRRVAYDRVVSRFFHPLEQSLFDQVSNDQRPDLFIQHWTCKEALLKYLGTGIANHIERYPILYRQNQAYAPDFPELQFFQIQLSPTDFMCVVSPEAHLEYMFNSQSFEVSLG